MANLAGTISSQRSAASIAIREQASELLANQHGSLFSSLPLDAIVSILSSVNLSTIATLSLCCKGLNVLAKDQFLWKNLFHDHFPAHQLDRTIPNQDSYLETFKKQHLFNSNFAKEVYALHTLKGHEGSVTALLINDGKLISGSADHTIMVWDLESRQRLNVLDRHKGRVTCFVMSGDNLISGSSDATIKIWDLKGNKCLKTLSGHGGWIWSLVVMDGKLFSGSADHTIKIWDLENGKCIQTLTGHESVISSLVIQEGRLISGSSDQTIKIWDLSGGECLDTLKEQGCGVSTLVTKDSALILSASDTSIRTWNLRTMECHNTLSDDENGICSLALAEGMFISGSWNMSIKVWDLEKNVFVKTLSGHTGIPTSLAFAEGKLIAGCNDNTIKIWDYVAPDHVIFGQIASQFKSGSPQNMAEAHERFSKMPKTARDGVYGAIYKIAHPFASDYYGCGEHAFHHNHGQISTPAQKALAIENYLRSR